MKNNIKKAPVKVQEDLLYYHNLMLIFFLCPKSVITTILSFYCQLLAYHN